MTPGTIEATYPLTPLQHGMLFHSLAEPRTGVDIEQLVCTLREPIDSAALQRSWQTVSARHAVLRTDFDWQNEPIQRVHASVSIPWEERDWTGVSDWENRFTEFLHEDRQRGFELNRAPLMRLTLFKLGEEDFRLVWTFHHALLDGRSFTLVLRDLFDLYDQRAGELEKPSRTFREHVAWLTTQNFSRSESYWRERLKGFTAPTPIVIEHLGECAAEPRQGERDLLLDASTTTSLRDLADRHGFTMNTLVQGAWALLLSRYSREEDIAFGATRACRKSSVRGADSIAGLLINTLPIRVAVNADEPLIPWLQSLREQWLAMRPHEHTPLSNVQSWSEIASGRRLFDSIVVFENRNFSDELRSQGGPWLRREFRVHEQTNFALTLAAYDGARLQLRIEFDRSRFADDSVERLLGHLQTLLEGMAADPQRKLGELPMLTSAERVQLTSDWNPSTLPAAPTRTIHELFEDQAALTPDAVAAACESQTLTYRELNGRANAVAAELRKCGVRAEVIVGLCMERSLDLIVGVLGILKAGGAYLPIDLAYPPERVAFMLEDAAAPVILTQSHLAPRLPAQSARVLPIDSIDFQNHAPSESCDATADSLAYVIYTSGSTGAPKGCCVTHANVTRLFSQTKQWFQFGASDVWTMFHSIAFDFSVWEIWGPLLHGGRLVVVPHALSRSPEQFRELLSRERVTFLNQTPSAFRQLIAADAATNTPLSLRYVVFGGEALELQSLAPWFERHGDTMPQLVNMYGITETTVHVTYRPLSAHDLRAGSVIGTAIPDLRLYILDEHLQPTPIGVAGEIFVGGAGVSRGYLRRPELTKQRFIASPFINGDRLYRTGDLARWLPSRDIEYLGRIDQQVKIRGFRIELGEIEAALVKHPAIREAAVIARDGTSGEKRLVAYIVPLSVVPAVHELREHLQPHLPDYMLPSAFVALPQLPLTQNGKLDVRALPEPEPERPDLGQSFVAPRDDAERVLASIWQSVLRLERVGIHDNFFELGGDSILSIYVVSKARQAGMHLTPKHLFDHPTIVQLAANAAHSIASDEEASTPGPIAPWPILRWFLDHRFADAHHWNQSFFFDLCSPLDPDALARAVTAVVEHHDAFHLRCDGSTLRIDEHGAAAFECVTLADETAAVEFAAAQQSRLNLVEGPLLRVIQVALANGTTKLLVVAHHLAIDGVSWRRLIEDVELSYRQTIVGEAIRLPSGTTSLRRWSELCARTSVAPQLAAELPFWQDLCERTVPLPRDFADGENTESLAETVTIQLTAEETRALVHELAAESGIRTQEVLLAAVATALSHWLAATSITIDVEGHGRETEEIRTLAGEACDLSRTIGWFTSIFPLHLQTHGDALENVREALANVPRKGFGFGLLASTNPSLRSRAEVLFNYLGRFEKMLEESQLFKLSTTSTGAWHAPAATRTHLLEINCLVVGGVLEARWSFSLGIHRRSTIEQLAGSFAKTLRSHIALARTRDDSYALSPIQQLYFTLESAQRNAGLDQWHCQIRGPLDAEKLRRTWQQLFARHTVLRSVFEAGDGAARQRVLDSLEPEFHREDWSNEPHSTADVRFERFLRDDLQRGLDPARGPLTRITLIRLGEQVWRFVWTHHHLQIDGWSWPLLFREMCAIYRGESLPPAPPYRDFIRWLARRNSSDSRAFWTEQLCGFTRPTPLPGRRSIASKAGAIHEQSFALNESTTRDLVAIARGERVSLNALLQAAWACLLDGHGQTHDVVFGATFSGRSADLAGAESIVGPLVNNVPLRLRVEPQQSLAELARAGQSATFAIESHQFLPLTEIAACSELPWHRRLFESILVFQNYVVSAEALRLADDVAIDSLVAPVRTNYPLTIVVNPGESLRVQLIALAQFFDADAVAQLASQLQQMLECFARGFEQRVAEVQQQVVRRFAADDAQDSSRPLVPPQTPLERAIAGVWAEAFSRPQIGVTDNFFDLGGHSLLMIQVHARLRSVLNRDLPLVRMFQHPTIQSLARHLEGSSASDSSSTDAARERAAKQRSALQARRRVAAPRA